MKRLIISILILLPSMAIADTHYVRKTGSGSACTQASPCLTIAAGLASMTGGDTLIVGDGTYSNEPISNPPSGSAGAYTVVRSENVGGAIIDMSGVTAAWSDTALSIGSTRNYIEIDGFKIRGSVNHDGASSNGPITCTGDYIKLKRIAVYDAPDNDNMAAFAIGAGADHVLVEECWAWGTGRYKFIAYQATNVIFRRCVARHDYHSGNNSWSHQEALFVYYDSTNVLYQNCIGIDVVYDATQYMYGAFWGENNSGVDKSGKITGCIVLNVYGGEAANLDRATGTRAYENTVFWDVPGGYRTYSGSSGPTPNVSFNGMTIGLMTGTYPGGGYEASGVGVSSDGVGTYSVTNSILYDINSYAVVGTATSNYNALFGNGQNFYGGASQGAQDITNINPTTNSLLYLPRIEVGSTLKNAGSGGAQIGAQILYQHGTSGTLYGETGYDTLTGTALWPFPNEALIKSDFASYSGSGPSGARGFCTGTSIDGTAQTLTKYIWEYLGNQIPSDIYGTTSQSYPTLRGGIIGRIQ